MTCARPVVAPTSIEEGDDVAAVDVVEYLVKGRPPSANELVVSFNRSALQEGPRET